MSSVAVVGSGGREHSLLWKLSRSGDLHRLYALPGNGGTSPLSNSIDVDANNIAALYGEIIKLAPDFVIVGPERPLALGLVDMLQRENIPCFGPTAAAANIESSKVFAKELMRDHGIPTADFETFDSFEKASDFVNARRGEEYLIIKADGLAAGKGAFVCDTEDEVIALARKLLLENMLGESGRRVVIEKKLQGVETSLHFWCDGERALALPSAQDYKRADNGDRGANTGGMGTYCPAPHGSPRITENVKQLIVMPLLRVLAEMGRPYRGILYAGLMLTKDGPKVIEFNCRFGDPETQVMMPSLTYDILPFMMACATGSLESMSAPLEIAMSAVCVVLAAEGYPDTYRNGIPLKTVADSEHSFTIHAGTKIVNGVLMNTGGRVLNAVGTGPDLTEARFQAYQLAERLLVPGLRYRTDIADVL